MSPTPAATALLLLLAAAAPSAAGDDAFAALRKEFAPRVAVRGEPGAREALVGRVGSFDTGDGAKLLMEGLGALCDRADEDALAFEKLRRQYEEINVPADVMKDGYKTRTQLQNRIMEEEVRQREDGRVLEAFREALKKYADARALAAVSSETRKLKSRRAKEVVAEGVSANPAGLEIGLKLAKEKDDRVTAAVLRGLRGRKEDGAFALARDCLLKSEAWPVRLEAVAVLEGVNAPKVLPALIEGLAKEDGRLRDDIRDALRRLTSQNFDADPEQWRTWWLENRSDIEGQAPDTALMGTFKGKAPAPEKKSVYGIESRSRRILFVIDVSGSMKIPIKSSKGTPTGLSPEEIEDLDSTKIEIAKRELKRAIRAVEPEAWFNIIAFQSHVVRWKEKMVHGDMATKNEAYVFVRDMEAAGGTWAYGALMEAFRLGGMGVMDKQYDPAVDTIYFISDGAPTNNDMDKPELQDPEVVLSAVREWNRLGKVTIHAIAIDPKAGGSTFIDFMKKLARQNNGQYAQRE
jgi:hypothetical protein